VAAFRIDLNNLAPQIAKPFSPDNVCDVNEVIGQKLDGCFIGACTTTEEELILAALVLEAGFRAGMKPTETSNRIVVPGSLEIAENLQTAGLLDIYRRAGFRINEPGCSMCLGIASDRAQPNEIWLSSQNRNFPNRMGKGSIAWLASAATVAASSFEMKITDPRPLLAQVNMEKWHNLISTPKNLPPITIAEPQPTQVNRLLQQEEEGKGKIEFAPITGRVQSFDDNIDTDAIIPGEFCHLADLQEIGAKAFYHFRPEFVERVKAGENIIVAGEGWGCGSSREHAAWALKGAGVRAIIAKSFAYIHKRNLVNEAIPFLIVRDENFYAAAKDGDPLEVDFINGTVSHRGRLYHGERLPRMMTAIMRNGGLIPHVRKRLTQAG
jgi:aconitate hydratase/homoaconitate hydratase